MISKTNIVIAGIGGVGGYFGGLLAQHYAHSDINIVFFARGENLQKIQQNGLRVIEQGKEFIAIPFLATDQVAKIGCADLIIVCTKTYDLTAALEQLAPCIDKNTILLPLQNGVNATSYIKQRFPENMVLEGCVYIVSHLKDAGVIENSGAIQQLHFGSADIHTEQLVKFENIFRAAGIDAHAHRQISTQIWEKYIFLSPTATATTFYNCSTGDLIEKHVDVVSALIDEVIAIAKSKGIQTDKHIKEKTIEKLKKLPPDTNSSMQRDFRNKKSNTELEALTGYVIETAQALCIETPVYKMMYAGIEKSNA
ncbi:MAG: ketopantoate reductase family protein [Bacteroidia bacterium]